MEKRGIVSLGGYIPRQRLSRRAIANAYAWLRPDAESSVKGTRAVSLHDEDAVTMAVEAAAYALTGVNQQLINTLFFASTSMPFADRQNSAIVAEALSLPRNVHCSDITGSLKSGLSALRQALESGQNSLVVAGEKRMAKPASPQEMLLGDGAAAFTVGSNELLAEFLGAYSLSVDMTDHYRASQSTFDYSMEERWVREEGHLKLVPESVKGLLGKTNIPGSDIDHVILCGPNASARKKIAAICGFSAQALGDDLYDVCGNTGSAHPLVMLAYTLQNSEPGQLILVSGFAQGCDSMLFRTTDNISKTRQFHGIQAALVEAKNTDDYIRYLALSNLIQLDWGIRAERDNRTAHSVFYRQREALTGFIGGRCTSCETVQFPRSRVCVNPSCTNTDTQIAEPFKDKVAHVKSYTHDWLAHSYNPPFMYGNVAFEGGATVMMEFVEFEADELVVGAPVKMTFRIKDQDFGRGYHRYFWKAALIPESK